MVARTPPTKQRKMVAPPLINPLLIRETLKKVDQCTARLQELQYIVTGGSKVISGQSLSPRSTRGYLKTSLRCKQESLRIKNAGSSKSPIGKFPQNRGGEWRIMSLPAMLVGETVGEILQASQFARDLVSVFPIADDPKTPITLKRHNNQVTPQLKTTTQIQAKRDKEKQKIRTEYSHSPRLRKSRTRIQFKVSPAKKQVEKENNPPRYSANRVSPKNKPWVKKTVLFPNPLFQNPTTPSKNQQQNFYKTRSPVIARNKQQTPHKFLIKSPVKIKSPPFKSIAPTRPANWSKKSPPKLSTGSKMRRSFSPSRLANKLAASPAKLRRSFSPSGFVKRLASPLKRRNSVAGQKSDELISGLRQRPFVIPSQFSNGRI